MVDDKTNGEPSTPEEQTVPKSRFDEVYKKQKQAEQDLQTLKSQPTDSLTPEAQKEKQAKDFLKGLVKEQLEADAKSKKAAQTKEQKEFNNSVDDVLAVNTEVNREEFLKFIEDNSEKYGILGVPQAMQLYKDFGKVKDDTTDEVKENLSNKPNLPKSKGTADTKPDYSGDKSKSYEQVVSELIEEAEGQGRK